MMMMNQWPDEDMSGGDMLPHRRQSGPEQLSESINPPESDPIIPQDSMSGGQEVTLETKQSLDHSCTEIGPVYCSEICGFPERSYLFLKVWIS